MLRKSETSEAPQAWNFETPETQKLNQEVGAARSATSEKAHLGGEPSGVTETQPPVLGNGGIPNGAPQIPRRSRARPPELRQSAPSGKPEVPNGRNFETRETQPMTLEVVAPSAGPEKAHVAADPPGVPETNSAWAASGDGGIPIAALPNRGESRDRFSERRKFESAETD